MRPQSGTRKFGDRVFHLVDSGTPLESFLALDQAVIELFMRFYNVPGRERSVLRLQNQRLHRAVRRASVTLNRQAGFRNSAEVRRKSTGTGGKTRLAV